MGFARTFANQFGLLVDTAELADDSVTNAKVKTTAAVALTKLATITPGGALMGATTTGILTTTAAGTSGQYLKSNGSSSPAFDTVTAAQLAAITPGGVLIGATTTGILTTTAAGTTAQVLTSNGASSPTWQAAASAAAVAVNAEARLTSSFTTTSTTFVDVTGLTVTFTTTKASGAVLVTASTENSVSIAAYIFMQFLADGATAREGVGCSSLVQLGTPNHTIYTGLTVASHTFKMQARITSGTASFFGGPSGSNGFSSISAIEL